jgi:hypothetical protein
VNQVRISDSVLHTLAKVIADAKAGSVEAVAIVAVGPDGRPRVHFAGEADLAPSINLGADIIKTSLMQQIIDAPGAVKAHSGLVLPSERN